MNVDPDLSDLTPALAGHASVAGGIAADDSVDLRPLHDAKPSIWQDLSELAKLRLNFLVMVTTIVGYAMANPDWSDWRLLIHTLVGTALAAAGASILNQYLERSADGLMHRTRRRPLPAGRIVPLHALAVGVGAAVVGLIELYFYVNELTAVIGALTVAIYVLLYTPMKRWTTLNTVVGAVPGALPPMMGVTAAAGSAMVVGPTFLGVQPIGWALFGILFFWQMPHFLAIAILYREDYARGGFKMLPCVDPDLATTSRQMLFYSLALIPITLSPTLLGVTGPIYFMAALLMGLAFFGFSALCALSRRRGDARQVFLASILYLPCLLAAMMVDKV